nr:reverse transcriptase domain-containing protein [Tanacetum cinerariifolium]
MHAGPRSVVANAMWSEYYWPTMHRNAREMIHKCKDCQIHRPVPRHPQQSLTPITARGHSTNGGLTSLAFSRKVQGSQMKNFVWDNKVCRFGLPGEIVSDNGKQFSGDPFKDWSLGEGIKSCPGEGNKNWLEELPHVLWAHRTMIKSRNDDTAFSLTYGTEAVIPAEIRMPTYRTTVVEAVHNDEELRLNLDLLEERRERAAIHEAKAKLKMTKDIRGQLGHQESHGNIAATGYRRNVPYITKDQPEAKSQKMYVRSSKRNVSRIYDQSGRDKTMPRQDEGRVAASIPTNNQRQAEQAFKQLKHHLAKLPMLVAPKPKEELIMYLSASYGAISAVLMTERDIVQTPVYFVSRAMQAPELNYTPMEKLVLALVCAAKRLRKYIQAHPIVVITDQPIKQVISRIGLILTSPEGTEFTYALRFQFTVSNNEAEYEALIAGLRIAAQIWVRNVHVRVDSKLVANQVLGTYVAKEENMIKYFEKAKSLISGFANFSISQVPISKNKKADALSKIASTSFAHLSKQVLVEVLKEKSIQEREMATIVEGERPTWMTLIIEYLRDETLPDNRNEARKLRIKAKQYELLEEILYRCSFLKPWLGCVGPLQANYVIREVHEGSCSMHAGPRSVVAKAMRSGYYWPTMHRDAREMIRKCKDCQIHRPAPRHPQQPLTPITARGHSTNRGLTSLAVSRKSNGLVERANRSLGEGIKARLGEGNKNWREELPHVLWAHRTMIKSRNDDTAFSLTYGTEAVIPAEIRMPTYRTTVVDAVHNDEELRLNLDLLEEGRERAAIRKAKAKLKMTKY